MLHDPTMPPSPPSYIEARCAELMRLLLTCLLTLTDSYLLLLVTTYLLSYLAAEVSRVARGGERRKANQQVLERVQPAGIGEAVRLQRVAQGHW